MRRILPLLLLTVFMLALAGPAQGCSCAVLAPNEMLEFAPVAFVGTMVGVAPGASNHTLTFEVDTVLAGEVPAEVDVVTATDSAGCGIDANIGARMAIFANDDAGYLSSSLCSSTDPETAINALGPGTSPTTAPPLANFDWQAVWLGVGAVTLIGTVWLFGRRRLA